MNFTKQEIKEIHVSWLLLSLAFTILYSPQEPTWYLKIFTICTFSVGLGFVLHELGHKKIAENHGIPATFHANYQGLIMANLIAIAGFIYVAPGAVYMQSNKLTKKTIGKISAIGPAINLILGLIFLTMLLAIDQNTSMIIATAYLGFKINIWIGLFNLIPAPGFDGKKILKWSKPIYVIMITTAITLFMYSRTI